MTEKDMVMLLSEIGWFCEKDETGDHFCVMSFEKVQIEIIPCIRRLPDYYRVSFMPSVSTRDFSDAVAFILSEPRENVPIIVKNDIPEKIINISNDDIIRISQEVVSWGLSQDLEKGLENYKMLPTNSKGDMPLRHLAALSIAGDIDVLERYQDSFEKGDRLEFVPYITSEMINRAVLLARERSVRR